MRVFAMMVLAVALTAPAALRAAEPAAPETVCTFVQERLRESNRSVAMTDWGQRTIFFNDYLLRYGSFDVDGDGVSDTVRRASAYGSVGGDQYDVLLSSLGFASHSAKGTDDRAEFDRLNEQAGGRLRWNYGQGWLPYKGRYYAVTFAEEYGALAQAVFYFEGPVRKVACSFRSEITERMSRDVGPTDESALADRPWAEAKAFCESFGLASDRKPFASATVPAASRTGYSMKGAPGRARSYSAGPPIVIDFDNDGLTEELLPIHWDSGAGRGGEGDFFVLARDSDSRSAKLLETLQRGGQSGFTTLLHVIDGKTYVEQRPLDAPPRRDSQLFHTVATVQFGESLPACRASFTVEPILLYAKPPANKSP